MKTTEEFAEAIRAHCADAGIKIVEPDLSYNDRVQEFALGSPRDLSGSAEKVIVMENWPLQSFGPTQDVALSKLLKKSKRVLHDVKAVYIRQPVEVCSFEEDHGCWVAFFGFGLED